MSAERFDQRHSQARGFSGFRRFLGALAASIVLFVVLLLPNDMERLSGEAFRSFPVELAGLVLLFALTPRVLAPLLRWLAAIALGLLLLVKLADMAAYEAMSRPFNPLLDFHLLDAVRNLLVGSIGAAQTVAVFIGVVLLTAAIAVGAYFAVRAIEVFVRGRRLAAFAVSAALVGAAHALPTLYPQQPMGGAVSHGSATLMRVHADALAASLEDLETFRREAATDPARAIDDGDLFAALEGKDVLMLFVESYGRTVIDNPLYSETVLPKLDAFQHVLDAAGHGAVSGYLTSPVVGGRSWLGHGSVLSGLWLDNQRRYNSLLVSDRATLVSDFSRAGWRSVAVMPAITMAWPEGSFFRYDAIHDFAGLGYRGLPFNWVTMPDQYTLSAFDRLERLREDRPPLFAEIALISSHAPWTPIPELVAWEDVGDGSIFNEQATGGDTPREVWSDHDRVREQFRLSIEYALENLASYVEERLQRDFVLIVLGDHQPARIITGETDNRDVPYHIISDDPAVLERIRASWPVSDGMVPEVEAEPMDAFRERLITTFSETDEQPSIADGPISTRSPGPM